MRIPACFKMLFLTATMALLDNGLPVGAVPVPLNESRLMAESSIVVEGRIVAITFLGQETRDNRSVWSYRAELCSRRVLKGGIAAGTVVRINWCRETWTGAGPEPDGRPRGPVYYPCEEVRVYLAKDRDGYRTHDNWNGKKLIRRSGMFRLPDRIGAIVRCEGR